MDSQAPYFAAVMWKGGFTDKYEERVARMESEIAPRGTSPVWCYRISLVQLRIVLYDPFWNRRSDLYMLKDINEGESIKHETTCYSSYWNSFREPNQLQE